VKVCSNTGGTRSPSLVDLADQAQRDGDSSWIPRIGQGRNAPPMQRSTPNSPFNVSGPPVGFQRAVHLITSERNASNIYEAKRRLLGGKDPMVTAFIPQTYQLRPVSSAFFAPSELDSF
jgi:hypothetical protein